MASTPQDTWQDIQHFGKAGQTITAFLVVGFFCVFILSPSDTTLGWLAIPLIGLSIATVINITAGKMAAKASAFGSEPQQVQIRMQ